MRERLLLLCKLRLVTRFRKSGATWGRLWLAAFQRNDEAGRTVLPRLMESDWFGTRLLSHTGGRRTQQKKETVGIASALSPERLCTNSCPSSLCPKISLFNSTRRTQEILKLLPSWWRLLWMSLCASPLIAVSLSPTALYLSRTQLLLVFKARYCGDPSSHTHTMGEGVCCGAQEGYTSHFWIAILQVWDMTLLFDMAFSLYL